MAVACLLTAALVGALVIFTKRPRAVEPSVDVDGAPAAIPLSFRVASVGRGSLFRTVDVRVRATGYPKTVNFVYLLLTDPAANPTADEILNYRDTAKLMDGTAARGRASLVVNGGETETTLHLAGRGMGTAVAGESGVVDGLHYRVFIVLTDSAGDVVTAQEPAVYTSAQTGMGMPFDSGSGTIDDPFLIRQLTVSDMSRYPDLLPGHPNNTMGILQDARMLDNIENMRVLSEVTGGAQGMADSLGLAYGLLTDLHLGNYGKTINSGQGWRPIGSNRPGNNPHVFTGVLTSVGETKTIYDLTIYAGASGGGPAPVQSAGLFGHIAYPAVVSNFRMSNAVVFATLSAFVPSGGTDRVLAGAGVVAGTADGAVVRDIVVTDSVLTGEVTLADAEVIGLGGLVGAGSATAFERCTVRNTTLQGDHTRQTADCGGIVGYLKTGGFRLSQMTGCAADNVAVRSHTNTGGLAGHLIANDDMTIKNCAVNGVTVWGVSGAGGIAGRLSIAAPEGDTVSIRNLSANNVSVQKNGALQTTFFGGGFGYIVHSRDAATGTDAVVVISDSDLHGAVTGDIYCGGFSGSFAGETGCSITVQRVDAHVRVDGTVQVGGFTGGTQSNLFSECSAAGAVTANSTAGGFAGTVTTGDPATFANCTAGGSVTAIQLAGGFIGEIQNAMMRASGCAAAGDVSVLHNSAGGFIGDSYTRNATAGSEIVDCAATGDVQATDDGNTNDARLGGFIGRSGRIKIDRCYATGNLSGGGMGGGFLGTNEADSYITNCYATGDINLTLNSPQNAGGGFAGVCAGGGVRFCYASGDVKAYDQAGGFCGRQEASGQITSVITLNSRTQTVRAGGEVGRVIGVENSRPYVANIFGERDMLLHQGDSAVTVSAAHKEGIPITAAEMRQTAVPLSWDTDVWDFDAVGAWGRPLLYSNPE